jgi:hypothetical protein
LGAGLHGRGLEEVLPRIVIPASFEPTGAAFGQIESIAGAPGVTVRVTGTTALLTEAFGKLRVILPV